MAAARQRHEVLIQLDDKPTQRWPAEQLGRGGGASQSTDPQMVAATGSDARRRPRSSVCRHFVVAKLTRLEVETLRSQYARSQIDGIWRNAAKRALIIQSTHTVQVRPANLGYGADGKRSAGPCSTPASGPTIRISRSTATWSTQWDCTRPGRRRALRRGHDGFRHAGPKRPRHARRRHHRRDEHVRLMTATGVTSSPAWRRAARSIGFKVLDDDGDGEDSWIIKALDTIAEINEKAGTAGRSTA